jgi:hypothetical protein
MASQQTEDREEMPLSNHEMADSMNQAANELHTAASSLIKAAAIIRQAFSHLIVPIPPIAELEPPSSPPQQPNLDLALADMSLGTNN